MITTKSVKGTMATTTTTAAATTQTIKSATAKAKRRSKLKQKGRQLISVNFFMKNIITYRFNYGILNA